jgi:ribosomal protein S18 acetylase RimI-like enzyme
VSAPFRLELLAGHDRSKLQCGEEILDRYFQTQATQDMRRRVANCFVAVEALSGNVAAYYTLSSGGLLMTDLPPESVKKLPRYPTVPAVRIGRLAVDRRYQGRGLGAAMLADALIRTLKAGPAAFALLVDAKNQSAAAFYRHHGFLECVSQPKALFLPVATAEKAFFDPADLAAALAG